MPVAVRAKKVLPLVSRIEVPIFGDVNVLLVSVCVPVKVATVESMATVTVPVPLPVVVIPVPAAMVAVPPWLMVELEPEVPAKVKREPPDVRQVEQEMVRV